MHKLILLIAGLLFSMNTLAYAQRDFVVVELFTSQGCYSCPPADAILHNLSKQDDIIALSLHVDYWDYLGWKDAFAISKFGLRQARYNARIQNRALRVTPQIVINGAAQVAGGGKKSRRLIEKYITSQRQQAAQVQIDLIKKDNGMVMASLKPAKASLPRAELVLVKYRPLSVVDITRGENAGKRMRYHNVVESLETVGTWNGKKTNIEFDLPEHGHYALFVQARRFGVVMGARKLKWFPS